MSITLSTPAIDANRRIREDMKILLRQQCVCPYQVQVAGAKVGCPGDRIKAWPVRTGMQIGRSQKQLSPVGELFP